LGRLSVTWLRRFWPTSLFGRLALLLFVMGLLSHALALTVLFELRPEHGPHGPLGPPPPPGPPPLNHPGQWIDISVRLAALTVAAWIGARWLSRPMQSLAQAAQGLGADVRRPPLAEEGPDECRATIRVFNQMQGRIGQQMADRDRFVAAVSHDLRTPLTRLALRVERLPDAADRQQFAQDIQEMNAMIAGTLDYLRGAVDPEPLMCLDITSLLESLVDDQRDSGHAVEFSGQAGSLMAQPSSLRRCVDNLVSNAVRYGGAAKVLLKDAPDQVTIEVHDQGPGIPPAELDKVLAPFYRVEASRNRNSGGVGLGLSIALEIALRHGGCLALRNATSGGLVATLTLPRRQ
jgi:signal transduction histidine kinase